MAAEEAGELRAKISAAEAELHGAETAEEEAAKRAEEAGAAAKESGGAEAGGAEGTPGGTPGKKAAELAELAAASATKRAALEALRLEFSQLAAGAFKEHKARRIDEAETKVIIWHLLLFFSSFFSVLVACSTRMF